MKRITALLIGCLALSTGAALAQHQLCHTTNGEMLAPCQDDIRSQFASYGTGYCWGAVTALAFAAPNVCLVDGLTREQVVGALVRY